MNMEKSQRYQIRAIEDEHGAVGGLEFLVDPPVHRRLYHSGEIVEIPDGVNVAALLAYGIIQPYDGSDTTARPATCPACRQVFVNTGGAEATCYRCGAVWNASEPATEGGP